MKKNNLKVNRHKLTSEAMIKKIMEDDTDFLDPIEDDELEEMNTTGAVAGYQTPGAFAKPNEPEDVHLQRALKKTGSGFVAAVNNHKNTYKMWEIKSLGESTYRQYVEDNSATAHQKVNGALHQINSKLFEIEKMVRQNVKLKNESGLYRDNYWKSTQGKLTKIKERLIKLTTEIQKFGE